MAFEAVIEEICACGARLELLETEVGRDHLEALAVGTRAARLEQAAALLRQQLAAQRCVASFLGAHEQPLRAEIAALRQARAPNKNPDL
jgi:hypothetical protein